MLVGITTSVFTCRLAVLGLTLSVLLPCSDSACTLPADLVGNKFFRPTDTTGLTFTSDSVDISVQYNGNPMSFACLTIDGNGDYIFKSSPYPSSVGNLEFYFCWRLVRVTASAYMLYELSAVNTEPSTYGQARGIFEDETYSPADHDVCNLDPDVIFWTTLVKEGSTASDVAVACPSLLQNAFTYNRCSGNSALTFCPVDQNKGTADYALCSENIFQSTNGVVYCMGTVERSPTTYVNLFMPEKGKETVCFSIQAGSGNDVTGNYYIGDCTTAADTPSLDLTFSAACDSGGDTGTTSTTTQSTTSTSSTSTSSTSTSSGSSVTTSGTQTGDSDSGGSDAGLYAGIAIGLLALLALIAFLLFWFVIKKKGPSKVSDSRDAARVSDMDSLPSDGEGKGHSLGNGKTPILGPDTGKTSTSGPGTDNPGLTLDNGSVPTTTATEPGNAEES